MLSERFSSVNLTRQRALYGSSTDRGSQNIRAELARLQEQTITQKEVNRASDDPTAFAGARKMESLARQYEQYMRSISASRTWSRDTQERLHTLTELFSQASVYGVQGATATLSTEDRETLARHIDTIRLEVTEQLNARSGDEYLFAGNETLAAPPFDANGDPVPADYSRVEGSRTRAIGPGVNLKVNVTGREVHDTGQGYTIIDSLRNLSLALRTPGGDVQTALGEVQTSHKHLIDVGARNGATLNRMDRIEEQLTEANLRVRSRQSDLEDADLLETMTALQKAQTSLEASLKVTASMLRTTLLDYID